MLQFFWGGTGFYRVLKHNQLLLLCCVANSLAPVKSAIAATLNLRVPVNRSLLKIKRNDESVDE